MQIQLPWTLIDVWMVGGFIWVGLKAVDVFVTACIPSWQKEKRTKEVSQGIWIGRAIIWALVAVGFYMALKT